MIANVAYIFGANREFEVRESCFIGKKSSKQTKKKTAKKSASPYSRSAYTREPPCKEAEIGNKKHTQTS